MKQIQIAIGGPRFWVEKSTVAKIIAKDRVILFGYRSYACEATYLALQNNLTLNKLMTS